MSLKFGLGLVALPFAAPAMAAEAEEGFSVSGDIRSRYEYLSGQLRSGFDKNDEMLSFRTNLVARYRKDGVEIGAAISDNRAYLDDEGSPVTTAEVNALELTQLYVGVKLGEHASVRIGRQIALVGSRRYVTNDDYRNTANGFTGIRIEVGDKRVYGTAFAFLPQHRLPEDREGLRHNKVVVDRESFDTAIVGGVVGFSGIVPGVSADFGYYGLFERDGEKRATRDRRLHTLTARLFRDPVPGQMDFEFEYAGQFGSVSENDRPFAARQDVRAWFVHAEVGKQWRGGWSPRVAAELEWASGDKNGKSFNRFDTLYGSRRPDLGPTGIFGAFTRANTIMPAARIEVTPSKRLDAFVVYRPTWLDSRTDAFSASGVRDVTGRSGRFAGHQIDFRVRRWLIPNRLRAEVDLAYFAKGRFMRDAPNAPVGGDARYAAMALTATF